MKNSIFENYTQQFPLSKTLRFKLIPQFETEENIKNCEVLKDDETKAKEYQNVKMIFDKCHKAYLEKMLNNINGIDYNKLYNALILTRKNKSDDFDKEADKAKKSLSKQLKSNSKDLTPEKIIKSILKDNEFEGLTFTDEEINSIKAFDKFATYFEGYKENRDNIYGTEQGSASYRIINENFLKFVDNINIISGFDDDLLNEADEKLSALTKGLSLKQIFNIDYYKNCLSQSKIDFYNTIIGGLSTQNNEKAQGLNEFINLKYQQGEIPKKLKLVPLYKQILSDRDSVSFIPASFCDDLELKQTLKNFADNLNESIKNSKDDLKSVFYSSELDKEKIYIDKKQITFLSMLLFDNKWSEINDLLKNNNIKEKKIYTLLLIETLTNKNILDEVWKNFEIKLCDLNCNYKNLNEVLNNNSKIENYNEIKAYLDSVVECEKILKIFVSSDKNDKDFVFYPVFDDFYNLLRSNIPVYNSVRNYATKKPSSAEKYKLNFNSPTLASGWDKNEEYKKNTMIFIKDDKYYIGILNAKKKPKIVENDTPTNNCFKKMVYKLLPGPNKMLPKVFLSKKGIETFNPSEYILNGYEQSKHKKGETFDLDFCHDLINYFKDCIPKYKDWSKFGFEFSNTQTYSDLSQFYNEISKQNYKVSFSYVDYDYLKSLVKNGQLFLFQIYNKDFSEYSKGSKNLHTLYWQQIFSEENILNPLFKLNGNAELFYRPQSIENPFVHKKGSILINKNDANFNPVPDEIYKEAMFDANNGMNVDELSKKYPNLIFKTAKWDIVKDKRYSKPEFSFHVPITINNTVDDSSSKINKNVLNDVLYNDDINIIGIDRGERNLIYVSVINRRGKILAQKSYNVIENSKSKIDYHKKLDNIEKSRDEARKNWKQIGKIKDVKEGYLSVVVKEICDMMIKYNAIIVLEDLNFGFKNGRFHIEKQVYQKFEKMLIDKLNYFADKNISPSLYGGIRNGYQLAPKFESFQKLGKQCGFMFYVPAAYTSKIDPLTGFVNLFTSRQLSYKNKEETINFINSFDKICFDKAENCFRFDFKYSNFDLNKTDYTNSWQVYTCGDGRLAYTKNGQYGVTQKVEVTQRLKDLFDKFNISYMNKDDLRLDISKVNDVSFYKEFLWLFKVTVSLRYEDENNDFILSPVKCENRFFDSRKANKNEPLDGDANGAYHIALQGLRLVKERIKNSKIQSDGAGKQNYNWFKFIQEKNYNF